MKPFKVHLRRKALPNGTVSLYLDFSRAVYHAGKQRETRRDFLGLYVHEKPRTKEERDHNRNILAIAESRRAAALLDIQNNLYGIGETEADKERRRRDADFLAFYMQRADMRAGKTREGWINAYHYLNAYTSGECRVKDITPPFLLEFKDFLTRQPISHNTRYHYFSKVKTAIREAYERGIVKDHLTLMVKNFAAVASKRPFLTNAEVKALKDTEFADSPHLKRASLFAILTGARWSDVLRLRFEMIRCEDEIGFFLPYKQIKTGADEILFLNDETLKICDYAPAREGRIFPISYWEKRKLKDWFKLAGVKKHAGTDFHIFRHTFAMRMLNDGEDIATVSALLGHKSIKNTQIYARILDKRKRGAMDKVTLG
jgi:integrase